MPPRSETIPRGVEQLIKIVSHLNSVPKLQLSGVKSLRISLAAKNDHFGARHFVKEELPRIRYANPDIGIEIRRALSTKEKPFKPTLDLELEDGSKKVFDIQEKWSTAILKDLMDEAGGEPWKRYVASTRFSGLPVAPGETPLIRKARETAAKEEKKTLRALPTLDEWEQGKPPQARPVKVKVKTNLSKKAAEKKASAEAAEEKPAVEAAGEQVSAEVVADKSPNSEPEPTQQPIQETTEAPSSTTTPVV